MEEEPQGGDRPKRGGAGAESPGRGRRAPDAGRLGGAIAPARKSALQLLDSRSGAGRWAPAPGSARRSSPRPFKPLGAGTCHGGGRREARAPAPALPAARGGPRVFNNRLLRVSKCFNGFSFLHFIGTMKPCTGFSTAGGIRGGARGPAARCCLPPPPGAGPRGAPGPLPPRSRARSECRTRPGPAAARGAPAPGGPLRRESLKPQKPSEPRAMHSRKFQEAAAFTARLGSISGHSMRRLCSPCFLFP